MSLWGNDSEYSVHTEEMRCVRGASLRFVTIQDTPQGWRGVRWIDLLRLQVRGD